MRWFFLLLLIVNVGYVTWELNRERPQQSATFTLPGDVERIVLLSELESESSKDDTVAHAIGEMAEPVQAASPVESAEGLQPHETSKAAEVQPAEVAIVDDAAVTAADVVGDKQAQASLDKAEEEPAGDLCYTLGPFREMKTLRLVTREIKDYVIEASFRSREEQEQSMFRVYLKPVGSKKEAKALVKELASKKIRDYFIITDGPNKNGISLGYFSSKSRAHRHARRVRKHGFDAIVEPVFRTYTIYWLDYRIKAGNEIPQQIIDQHLDNTTQRLSRTCA
jgi:hypothetical protein